MSTDVEATGTAHYNDRQTVQEETKMNNTSPMRNHDGSAMIDQQGKIVYRSQFLSTHPLQSECKELKLGLNKPTITYLTGGAVIRNLNFVFGHDGWSTEITNEKNVTERFDSSKGQWNVGYLVRVRITLKNGNSHEDYGGAQQNNENKFVAHENAIKAAVTDAVKRAARHFGERLGNALYVEADSTQAAPIDNKTALQELEQKETLDMGDQQVLGGNNLDRRNEQNATARIAETESPPASRPSTSEIGPASTVGSVNRQAVEAQANHSYVYSGNNLSRPAVPRQGQLPGSIVPVANTPSTYQAVGGHPRSWEGVATPSVHQPSPPYRTEVDPFDQIVVPTSNQRPSYQTPNDPKRPRISPPKNPYQR